MQARLLDCDEHNICYLSHVLDLLETSGALLHHCRRQARLMMTSSAEDED